MRVSRTNEKKKKKKKKKKDDLSRTIFFLELIQLRSKNFFQVSHKTFMKRRFIKFSGLRRDLKGMVHFW